MSMIQFAKDRGATPVTLRLERHAVYASTQPTGHRETTVKAYRLEAENGAHYFWGKVSGFRENGSDFISTRRARFLIVEEK